MTEREIITGCQANDRRAQKAFVELYTRYVYAICKRYTNDAEKAKDCMQESLMQVLNHIDKYKEEGKFKSWVAAVTVRKCINMIRSEKRHIFSDIADVAEPKIEESTSFKLELQDVKKFIDTLPDSYRIVINMFIMEGYSHKEISEHLGLTESSSRSILTRARKMIMENFERGTVSLARKKRTSIG